MTIDWAHMGGAGTWVGAAAGVIGAMLTAVSVAVVFRGRRQANTYLESLRPRRRSSNCRGVWTRPPITPREQACAAAAALAFPQRK